MYLDVTEKKYPLLKRELEKRDIKFEVIDYKLTNGTKQHHLEFGAIDPEVINEIYEIYVAVSEIVKQPVKKSKWYDRYHTPTEEMIAHITGKNTEEELVYE